MARTADKSMGKENSDLIRAAQILAEDYNIHHAHCFQVDDAQELKELFDAKLEVIQNAIKGSRELSDQKFTSRDEATKTATDLTQKRLEEVQTIKHQLDTQLATFLTKDVYESKHDLIQQQLNEQRSLLATYQSQQAGQNKGISMAWAWVFGGITFVAAVVALLLNAIRLFELGQ